VSHYFEVEISFSWLIILFLFLVAAILFRAKSGAFSNAMFGLLLTLFFTCVGIFSKSQSDSTKDTTYFTNYLEPDSTTYLRLTLTNYPSLSEKWLKCEASVNSLNDQETRGKIQVFIARDSSSENLAYGDQIYASGFISAINAPMNPNEFDYRAYMKLHDIHHQIFIRADCWKISGNDANPILESIYSIRNYCSNVFENSGMDPENIAVAKALVLGDKALISDELMLSYASTGALHVLAVSGLHVGIIMLILGFLLKPLKSIKKVKFLFLIFALCGIWFYAILTGLTPSVLRAAVMFSFVLIGSEMQRDTSIYQSLMISAIILLLMDPNVLFQLGFLLSYFAVIGIVFFHPKLYALLFFKNKFADKIWQVTCVSIAAQLATFPLGIYCFQQFPNYFLLANLIVIPISFLVLIVGIVALILNVVPLISSALFYFLGWLIYLLNNGVRAVESLPFAVFDSIVIRWYDAILLYLFIIFMSYSILHKSKFALHVSLLFLTSFFISDTIDHFNKSITNQIVFYKMQDEIVLDIFNGKEFSTVSTLSIQESNQDLKFHVEPNRLQLAGKKSTSNHFIISPDQSTFEFENKNLVFADQRLLDSLHFPTTDAVYLYNCKFISEELLQHWSAEKTLVILGHNCTYRLKKHLKQRITMASIHDISTKGALIIRF
jgi:competence protein ComEC